MPYLMLPPGVSNKPGVLHACSSTETHVNGKILALPAGRSRSQVKVLPNVVSYGAAISACDKGSQHPGRHVFGF